MQPIRTQVLVKPYPSDEISEGGILIPESVRKPSNKVKIIKVGRGTQENPMKLKEGDTAFRVKDTGCEVMINDELHYLIDQSAILATDDSAE
jgi:chaperonin GroES